MANTSDPTPVTVRQCRMLSGWSITTLSPQQQCCPVASGLGASSTGHFPIPSHAHPTIHPDIVPSLKKVFEQLSHPTPMERCVLEVTQNQNELFNSTIWQRCPKKSSALHHGEDCCQFPSTLARFPSPNSRKGWRSLSPLTKQYHFEKDHHRVSASVTEAEVQVKRRRRTLHLDRVALEKQQVA